MSSVIDRRLQADLDPLAEANMRLAYPSPRWSLRPPDLYQYLRMGMEFDSTLNLEVQTLIN